MNKDFFLPIVSLTLICLFVSGALAFVNTFTRSKIEKDAQMRAEQEMGKIIPQADNFIEIKNTANIPRTISGIFKAAQNENTLGYIFMISIPGYGGDIKIVCGIDKNGKIIKTQVLSHTETKGMTDPVFSDPHQSQYTGKDKNLLDIIAVTGATVSSTAYKNGIKDAFLAFDIVSVLNKGAAHE